MTESISPTQLEHPFTASAEQPDGFVNPFQGEPHPLAKEAAEVLQAYIAGNADVKAAADEGKMFGVLVVEGGVFLAAYSGLLGGRNDWPGFVPPVFDAQKPEGHFKTQERTIRDINNEVERMELSDEYVRLKAEVAEAEKSSSERVALYNNKVREAKTLRDMLRLQRNMSPEENTRLVKESQFMKAELHRIKKREQALIEEKKAPLLAMEQHIEALKEKRRRMSDDLQRWLFVQYEMLNEHGEKRNLLEIFGSLPPAGSGDCCAPKLLQYAFAHGLKPLCLAEFWWGAPPKAEIRHHLHFYPPCRGKCLPILRWMCSGFRGYEGSNDSRYEVRGARCENSDEALASAPDSNLAPSYPRAFAPTIVAPTIVYEDDYLAVVSKRAGILSVPGKIGGPSVESLMRQRWHDDITPIIVHRLDMDTSGLMVVARTKWTHQQLQAQFARHEVSKRYEAILDGSWPADRPLEGEISLPLRPDIDDRPRQLVDPVNGKEARTRYRVAPLGVDKMGWGGSSSLLGGDKRRVSLFPLTGRTHQLRVHCAHPNGLGIPILGDALYGKPADRLYLHAAEITFRHPKTGELLTFTDEPHWGEL